MVKTRSTYECGVCGDLFETLAEAEACEAQPEPTTQLPVGAFVGTGVHGWWNADKSWTLALPQEAGERHSPDNARKWLPAPAELQGVDTRPGWWWFLPIWRVVGVTLVAGYGEPGKRHRIRYALWTPRHSNAGAAEDAEGGVAERKVWVASIRSPTLVISKPPTLTEAEQARFDELVAVVQARPALVDTWGLL